MPKRKWESTGFGVRLKAVREAAGQSQQHLADSVSVDVMTVSRLERGEQEPSWPLVLAFGKALGISCDAFQPAGEAETLAGAGDKPARGWRRKAPTSPAAGAETRSLRAMTTEESDLADALLRALGTPAESQIKVNFLEGRRGGIVVQIIHDEQERCLTWSWATIAEALAGTQDMDSTSADAEPSSAPAGDEGPAASKPKCGPTHAEE